MNPAVPAAFFADERGIDSRVDRSRDSQFPVDPHASVDPSPGGSRGYFRIPRSADVSASMNAGRENSLSAYFISGAAGLGSWMP